MKTLRYLSLIIIILYSKNIYSYTLKSGNISSKEVWADTIHVIGDITITKNGSLIINSGTLILFDGEYGINISLDGKINANGTIQKKVQFLSNNTQQYWSGIKFEDMSATADSSIFNYCTFSSAYGAMNIYIHNKIRLSNCIFTDNYNMDYGNMRGGGLYCDSSNIVIYNSTFKNNYAEDGGGIFFNRSDVRMYNSRISNNRMDCRGAGIMSMLSKLRLYNCLIDNNLHSNSNGGAGMELDKSNVELYNCKLINNVGNAIEAYISEYDYTGSLKLYGCLVANNVGTDEGVIKCEGIKLYIINSTIVNNSGGKSAAYRLVGGVNSYYCYPLKIINSIFQNNSGKYQDLYFSIFDGYYPEIRNNNFSFQNNKSIPDSILYVNFDLIPRFNNPSGIVGPSDDGLKADWSLMSCSELINKGLNKYIDTILSKDLNKNLRIYDDTVDLGAIEYTSSRKYTDGKRIIYVKENGTGDGTSWSKATGNLQKAINTKIQCNSGIEIWVAKGNYYPDTTGIKNLIRASFMMKNNVSVYGGFSGNEDSLSKRDFKLNETVLNGDILKKNNRFDFSYHVVISENLDNSSVLDGFTIINGNAADYMSSDDIGGGIHCIYSNAVFKNLIIKNNYAGSGSGLALDVSSPKFINCRIFNNNSNSSFGEGEVTFNNSNPEIINCRIFNSDNNGVYSNYSKPVFVNTIISNNQGCGIYCNNSNPKIINSVIAYNISDFIAGGIYIYQNSTVEVYNSIMWSNFNSNNKIYHFNYIDGKDTTIKFKVFSSIVQRDNVYDIPGNLFSGNFDINPEFKNVLTHPGIDYKSVDADWGINACSPCINKGKNKYFNSSMNTDIILNKRIYNDTIDIGPYEYQGNKISLIPARNIVYVKPGGKGNGSSWNDATGSIQSAIDAPCGCYKNNEVWVFVGKFYPDTNGLADQTDACLELRNNKKIFGGFIGNETSADQRNTKLHKTIISGNIGSPKDSTDNCRNLISLVNQDSILLDGFILKDAYNNIHFDSKAVIFSENSHFTFRNVSIENNASRYTDGIIRCYKSGFKFDKCNIINNISDYSNFTIDNSNFEIANTKIINNTGSYSGGLDITKSKGIICNSIISDNNGGDYAGGINSNSSVYSIVNSNIINNNSIYLNSINSLSSSDTLLILNSIIWDDSYDKTKKIFSINENTTKIINSDIIRGENLNMPAVGYINNIDADPVFYGRESYDIFSDDYWKLKSCSPCVDNGLYDPKIVKSISDISGNPRIYKNKTIDIGPFEYQGDRKCLSITFLVTYGKKALSDINVSLGLYQGQYKNTNSQGICKFDDFSHESKLKYSVYYNGRWIEDSIRYIYNDTLIKVDFSKININLIQNDNKTLIYPDPACDRINIEQNLVDGESVASLFSFDGKLILSERLTNPKSFIDISNLQSGIFIIRIVNANSVYERKIVKL
ncbi:MAG: right-handed parallel beta-helix repeat-containing protein [Bacteroidota bacterium]|nr:right-handed parallel beta-helix repeat-containing protein [Bacteroidota bacterium]